MSSLKMELKKRIEEERITAQILEQIDAIDDDDKTAVEAARSEADRRKTNVETDIIPDETPIYVTGPGFDDFSSPEEAARFYKKYPNIILVDDTPSFDDYPIGESDDQNIDSAKTEITEEEKFEQMVSELEKLF